MHFKTILAVFVVICCLSRIDAQNRDCQRLKQQCDRCVTRLNDRADRDLPLLNRVCREKVARRWVWRNINRCQLVEINCRGQNVRMDCANIARLAGMRRIQN